MVQIKASQTIPSTSAQADTGESTSQQRPAHNTCKTTQLLKKWPIVADAAKKTRETYQSVKQSCRLISWTLSVTEATTQSLIRCAGNNMTVLRPVVSLADTALSSGVEDIEKKFPVVKESPEKVYESVGQKISDFMKPVVDESYSITEIGKKKINSVAKTVVKKYHGMINALDDWMDKFEKCINEIDPLESAQPFATPSTSESSSASQETTPPAADSSLKRAVRTAVKAASTVAAFHVGAAYWLLSRAPLVRGLVSVNGGVDGSAAASPDGASSPTSVVTVVTGQPPQQPAVMVTQPTLPEAAGEPADH